MYLVYISKLIQFKQQEKHYRECVNTANVLPQATGMGRTFAPHVLIAKSGVCAIYSLV